MKPHSDRLDAIRQAVAKVDALASATEEVLDNTLWGGVVDRQRLERAANLIGLTREAAEAALVLVDAATTQALTPTTAADAENEKGDATRPANPPDPVRVCGG